MPPPPASGPPGATRPPRLKIAAAWIAAIPIMAPPFLRGIPSSASSRTTTRPYGYSSSATSSYDTAPAAAEDAAPQCSGHWSAVREFGEVRVVRDDVELEMLLEEE
eukprot:CAMPEP_0197577782 /NCGR_PEP_ID=MMETSP1326-20131121/2284_1 /TAXON_ID=1155430 /ORGANISM="Genus nov. species nov., Strain RCC2288" /LENGTH=105 /DNA_ID=CAMNT_0043140897 /DNA_START=14 /DNA_END=329 /DNA_ORIENTATION=-